VVTGRENYVLAWNNTEGKNELFLATDVMNALRQRGPPTLVDEYLLHILLRFAFDRDQAIRLQQQYFTAVHYQGHYPRNHFTREGSEYFHNPQRF